MVVIRSPSPQLVPFKLHRFGQQRRVVSDHGGYNNEQRVNKVAGIFSQSFLLRK
jgi:hypothetical protein